MAVRGVRLATDRELRGDRDDNEYEPSPAKAPAKKAPAMK